MFEKRGALVSKLYTKDTLKPNRGPAKRARFGKEAQRNEREMTFDAKHK